MKNLGFHKHFFSIFFLQTIAIGRISRQMPFDFTLILTLAV